MKKHLQIVVFTIISCVLQAQVTDLEKDLRTFTADTVFGWRTGAVVSVTFAQTHLSNWVAGGQNSIAVNGLFSVFENYKAEKFIWDNNLDVGYGLLKQGKKANFLKTDDKVELVSKYGRKAFGDHWYYSGLLSVKSQLTPGYNYPNDTIVISDFMAPGYVLSALGLDFKPSKYLTVFFAPLTSKITVVSRQDLADAGAFGVDAAEYDTAGVRVKKGKNTRSEVGGYVRFMYSRNDFKKEWLKNVSFTTKMDLFSNYLNNPQNIDVSWETLLAFKINKYLAVNINTHLIYDHDIDISVDDNSDGIPEARGPRLQFKEIFGVGFSYKY